MLKLSSGLFNGLNWWKRACWQWLKADRGRLLLLTIVLLCLLVRFLPYLAPVRARDLVQTSQAIEFRDRNGLPLGTLLTRDQDHTMAVPLDQVSSQFIQAILAAEDGRFYRHGPLELRAILRSLREAIRERAFRSGASTVTMQLAKMVDPVPSTLPGKLREVWLAWRMAAGMTKDEILAAYINRIPMGGNIYGVEAAARIYFAIPAKNLDLAQASLLAALPNDPVYLSPYDHWDDLKVRQRYVLNRMVKDDYLTQSQADLAFAEQVTFQPRNQGIVAAPHFLFWLADQLPDQHPAQMMTTIDRPLQQFAEAQITQVLSTLAGNNVNQAALIVLDNATGDVLAYVGSPDYFAESQLGRNDGVQALRQPGSALKPFLYELALETGKIRPNSILADVPTYYAIPGAQIYSPTDYSETFQGPVRVRFALANSLNVPAVRVLEQVGVPVFLDRLRQLGFTHLTHPPDYYGLGLTLGSGEVSLWELARAYLLMANHGQPRPIQPTLNLPPFPFTLSPSSPPTWALITDMLSDRYARAKAFGVDSVLSLPFPAAVKTGTSSDYRDTWTVGFTSRYTVAVWVGNFNGDPMHQVSGVTGAAPLWQRMMLHLHEQQEPTAFSPPQGLVKRPICAITGWKPTPDCQEIVQEYFYPEDLLAYERSQTSGATATQALPPDYNDWLARQPQILQAAHTLRIVTPRNGDFFLLEDSPEVATSPRLELKLATVPAQPVEWRLNGETLAVQATHSFFWPIRPGQWTLEVRSGDLSDRVSFEVGVAKTPGSRRGFSLK